MSSRNGIAKLALSGFQVFDSLTEIPLERLTLIFGPNSAGKSSVEDAISILERIWTPYAFEVDWRKLNDDVLRHWRRTGAGANYKAPLMQLNATFLDSVDINEPFCISTGRPPRQEGGYRSDPLVSNFELRTSIVLTESAKQRHEVSRREVFADNLPLFSTTSLDRQFGSPSSGKQLKINFSHPALSQLMIKVDFEATAKNFPRFFNYADGVVTLIDHPFPELLNWSLPNFRAVTNEMLPDEGDSPEEMSYAADVMSCIPAVREFSLFLNILDEIFCSAASFDSVLVPASRHVPSNDELTFLVPHEIEGFGIRDRGDKPYRPLAESFVDWLKEGRTERSLDDPTTEPMFKAVNTYLAGPLFAERGYHLNFDYLVVSSPERDGVPASEISHLVSVDLIDPQGRQYDFEDVGSGLGYVLPVLCGICDSPTKIVMLQQPELHLHPALQAEMGDVLIEAAMKRKWQPILAETHSEHLLLRVLRRVRQTHEDKNTSPSLRIRADEVSVLYFEPVADGTTSVRRLRISDDGEFMDRWPRGFFTERDKELFDE